MGFLESDVVHRLNASGQNYYIWLCDKIRAKDHPDSETMLRYIFDTPFRWKLDMDENRKQEGLLLREQFETETGYPISEYKEVGLNVPCSVLEMIIALADKIENHIMYDPERGNRTHFWFWIMVDNLGLTKATNEEIEYNGRFCIPYLDYVLDTWMEREFSPDGEGSIFPLKDPSEDQRNVEIWYQCMKYLDENFPLF